MNRRSFIRSATATLTVLYLTACGKSATAIAAFVSVIANYGAQLANSFGATSIAGEITTLAATIATAITNWQNGGTAADAIEALNTLEDLLNEIPFTAAYAGIADLLIGAVEGLLALLPSSTATLKASATLAHTSKLAARRIKRRIVTPMHIGSAKAHDVDTAKASLEADWARLTAVHPVVKK